MKNLKTLFAVSVTLLASQVAQATSPILPYVPSESFKYECEVTLVTYSYRQGQPAKQYTSKAKAQFDNNEQFLVGERLSWTHKYAESNPNLPFMPEGRPVASAPGVKETILSLNFDYPQNGVTNLKLSATVYGKSGATNVHNSGVAFGTFDDSRLGTEADVQQYTDNVGASASKRLSIRCEKI